MFAWRFLSVGCLIDIYAWMQILLTVLMRQNIVKTIELLCEETVNCANVVCDGHGPADCPGFQQRAAE